MGCARGGQGADRGQPLSGNGVREGARRRIHRLPAWQPDRGGQDAAEGSKGLVRLIPDPYVREKYTKRHNAARALARDYFRRYLKDLYETGGELARGPIGHLRIHDEASAGAALVDAPLPMSRDTSRNARGRYGGNGLVGDTRKPIFRGKTWGLT